MVEAAPPQIVLGRTRRGGLGPSIYALVERGVLKRPEIASSVRGLVQLEFTDGYPPVAMRFERDRVVVEDAAMPRADLTIRARLSDVVLLTTAPLRMGLPSPTNARGRAVIQKMATGAIRLSGDLTLARSMLSLMRIDVPVTRFEPASEDAPVADPAWIDVLT